MRHRTVAHDVVAGEQGPHDGRLAAATTCPRRVVQEPGDTTEPRDQRARRFKSQQIQESGDPKVRRFKSQEIQESGDSIARRSKSQEIRESGD